MWLGLEVKFNKSSHVQNSFHGLLWQPSRETHTLHFSTRPVPRFNHQGSVFSAFTDFEIFLLLLPNSHQNKALPEDVAPTKHPHKQKKKVYRNRWSWCIIKTTVITWHVFLKFSQQGETERIWIYPQQLETSLRAALHISHRLSTIKKTKQRVLH